MGTWWWRKKRKKRGNKPSKRFKGRSTKLIQQLEVAKTVLSSTMMAQFYRSMIMQSLMRENFIQTSMSKVFTPLKQRLILPQRSQEPMGKTQKWWQKHLIRCPSWRSMVKIVKMDKGIKIPMLRWQPMIMIKQVILTHSLIWYNQTHLIVRQRAKRMKA